MQFVFGILLMAQLSLPSGAVPPQVMSASFKPSAIVKAGQKADIAVSFNVIKPYAINRTPEITLKLDRGTRSETCESRNHCFVDGSQIEG